MKKYKFRKYSKKYPKLFEKEKKKLQKILPKEIKIKHIGSTSVPGLGGKGLIDVGIMARKKIIPQIEQIMLQNKYILFTKLDNLERISFKKDYGLPLLKRRVHVHVSFPKSQTWKKEIKFRKNLLKNKKVLNEYIKIKKKGVKIAKGEGKKYREYKKSFIEKHSK